MIDSEEDVALKILAQEGRYLKSLETTEQLSGSMATWVSSP